MHALPDFTCGLVVCALKDCSRTPSNVSVSMSVCGGVACGDGLAAVQLSVGDSLTGSHGGH